MPMGESVCTGHREGPQKYGRRGQGAFLFQKAEVSKVWAGRLGQGPQALSEESSNPEYDPLVEGESVGHI